MTLDEKIADAESKYHALLTGTSARVIVDGNNGDRVEYTSANRESLRAYIAELKAQKNYSTRSLGPAIPYF